MQITAVKLSFARRGREILHISQVERGLACLCHCLGCGDDLVARKGLEVAHHFAHHAVSDCDFSPESALHQYAKHLIAAQPTFRTPPLDHVGENVALVSEAWLERAIGDVVPDVQLDTDAGPLLVEVLVTNAADKEKRQKLRRIQVPAVEIDLSDLSGDEPLECIDFAVLEDIGRRSWLYHPLLEEKARQQAEQANADRERMEAEQQKKRAKQEADGRVAEQWVIALAKEEFEDTQEPDGLLLIGQAAVVDAAEIDRMLRAAPEQDRTRLYCLLAPVEKLAYHLYLLGRVSKRLLPWCNERPSGRSPFVDPAIVWRTGVLLKFAGGDNSFTLGDVVLWCTERFPLRNFAQLPADGHGKTWDVTVLTSLGLAVFEYLDQLQQLGYVDSDGWIPQSRRYSSSRRFRPRSRRPN